MLATVALVAALAAGAALSSIAASKRASAADARDVMLERYDAIALSEPDALDACQDARGLCDTVRVLNADRLHMTTREAARLAAMEAARAELDARYEDTAMYLDAHADCAVRRSLADALRGNVTVDEADAAMLALDHVLEASPDALRDVRVAFAPGAVTLVELADAVRANGGGKEWRA